MKSKGTYRLLSELLPGPDWPDLFNLRAYFDLHIRGNDHYLGFKHENAAIPSGIVHFSEMEKGHFRSPARATYGGFQLNQPDYFQLREFVSRTEGYLKERGATMISVVAPPMAHSPAHSADLFDTFISRDWRIGHCDLNYSIRIDHKNLREKMSDGNRKRLRKCREAGYSLHEMKTREGYAAAFDIIRANREAKGYDLSMTLSEIEKMKAVFETRVHFFMAGNRAEWVASAICLALNEEVLYVLFWGDLPGCENFSPVTVLADGLYEWAKARGFKLLDVGTASPRIDGRLPEGLVRFKTNLGAESSPKLSWTKKV